MGIYSEYIFPWMLERWGNYPEGPMNKLRRETLEGISGRVLDVGFGIGFNIIQYPKDVSEVVALDPSEGVTKRAKKYIGGTSVPVNFVKKGAEEMPFGDNEFDAVVSTLTLCSVGDLSLSLAEIKRVLKSTGSFHFLEHVAATEKKDRRLQDLFNPLNKKLFCGCNLNRETEKSIVDTGFKLLGIDRFYPSNIENFFPDLKGWPKFMLYMIRGVAKC